MFFRVDAVEYLVREYVLSEHLIFNLGIIIGNLLIDQTHASSYFFPWVGGVLNKGKGICTI